MIVSDYFVYIHTSRSAGTFLNRLILDHVPSARMLQYHGHLRDLPEEYSHLPVIGFVRNPWDWYVSMFFDYRRKQQYIYQIVSKQGALGFINTVARFLQMGDGTDKSRQLLQQLAAAAPTTIDEQTPARLAKPGLRSEHFSSFPSDCGYYSWLFQLMYETSSEQPIHIGRFENLRNEALRLLELTGTPITNGISKYLAQEKPLNAAKRPSYYAGGYSAELAELLAEKERYVIERFGYTFSQANNFPKADFFRNLGSADVDALIERVKQLPDSEWRADTDDKPNQYRNLSMASHFIFRFPESHSNMFDYEDYPSWHVWRDVLLPIMEKAAQELGYTKYGFPRAMLAKLPAGEKITRHKDSMASFYIHKIHVPLMTNPETIFHVGAQSEHLGVGEIVEVNNKRIHAVDNDGDTDRIHLIFECYNMDDYGKVD